LPTVTRKYSTRLAAVPLKPGVYIHIDSDGKVLYVGKSSSLRNRLRSYFGSKKNLDAKTTELVSRIADFEFIVTESEPVAQPMTAPDTSARSHQQAAYEKLLIS
jgi:excinuclease UvrABC nuclease subunit